MKSQQNLVNQAKSSQSLRNYLYQKLSQIQLYNIVTGSYDNALEILNKNKCYGLTKFMKGKRVCDDYPFATQEGKLFGRVIEYRNEKDRVKIEEVIEEKPYTTYKKQIIGIYKSKYYAIRKSYNYEKADVIPVSAIEYEPIFKRRKIGKKFYYTTEYKQIFILKYAVVNYIKIEKIRKIKKYIEKKIDPIKAEYDYKFKYYIQYFLFEMYREEGDKIIHETFINPFYSGYSVVEPTFYTGTNDKPEYVTPEAMWNSGYIQLVTNKAKSDLVGRKPKKLKEGKLDDFFKRERKYKSNYSYDESVIDTVFFTDYDTIANNLKIDKV